MSTAWATDLTPDATTSAGRSGRSLSGLPARSFIECRFKVVSVEDEAHTLSRSDSSTSTPSRCSSGTGLSGMTPAGAHGVASRATSASHRGCGSFSSFSRCSATPAMNASIRESPVGAGGDTVNATRSAPCSRARSSASCSTTLTTNGSGRPTSTAAAAAAAAAATVSDRVGRTARRQPAARTSRSSVSTDTSRSPFSAREMFGCLIVESDASRCWVRCAPDRACHTRVEATFSMPEIYP